MVDVLYEAHVPNICAVRSALQTSESCVTTEEIKASEACRIGHGSVALTKTRRSRPSVILAWKLAIGTLAGPLRQFHVEGVQDIAHSNGVSGAARA